MSITCKQLDKNPNSNLKQAWNNCVVNNRMENNPEWVNLTPKEKQDKINNVCCNEALQCTTPNQWLKDNKINVTCPKKGSNGPHFDTFNNFMGVL